MSPSKMLQQAKTAREEPQLKAYAEAIWELRRKGNSYREIAAFLNARGVVTDHTAVFRMVAAGNPLLGHSDGRFLIGDVEYEVRKGRQLRPFSAGLFVEIVKRSLILPLQRTLGAPSSWCEAQFELNTAPNHLWLQKLSALLGMAWNSDSPCHLRQQHGFELKFEGRDMAMVCGTFNLEQAVPDLETAVQRATEFFVKDKEWMSGRQKLREEQKRETLEQMIVPSGSSEDEEFADCAEWSRDEAEELTKRFKSIKSI